MSNETEKTNARINRDKENTNKNNLVIDCTVHPSTSSSNQPRSVLADCKNIQAGFPIRQAGLGGYEPPEYFSYSKFYSAHSRVTQLPNRTEKITPNDAQSPPSQINLKVARQNKVQQFADLCPMLPAEFNFNFEYLETYMVNSLVKDVKMFLSFGTQVNSTSDKKWTELAKYVTKIHAADNQPSYLLCQNLKILNAYLQIKEVCGEDLIVAAVASMWISAKKDNAEPNIPQLTNLIIYLPANMENKHKCLLDTERDILKTLDFNIAFPDPHSVVAYFLITERVPDAGDVFYCSSYIIDLSLQVKHLVVHSLIELSTTALEFGLFIVSKKGLFNYEKMSKLVLDCFAFFINRNIFECGNSLRNELMKMVFTSRIKGSKLHHVYKKYTRSIYGKASEMINLLDLHDYEKFGDS